MNFFQRRRCRKMVNHLLHEARHAGHMRRDVASAASLKELEEAQAELREAWKSDELGRIEHSAERVAAAAQGVYPPRPRARLRENVEIVVVALAVAMGFRTYFIQPFKIPTGSMQPTLFGITVEPRDGRTWMDVFPLSVVNFIVFGERYQEVRAKAAGRVELRRILNEEYDLGLIGGVRHPIRKNMKLHVVDNSTVARGQLIASGRLRFGDHIFVNKLRYNFSRPKRGDIFVFSTDGVQHPDVRKDTFYIKRIVGLPGETLSIEEPSLVVNGMPVTEPYPFHRQLHDPGYPGGYTYARHYARNALLQGPGDRLPLGKGEYLPMGDNTFQSLDGRYFGAISQQNIIGPAFCVYWPFGNRWGRVQ